MNARPPLDARAKLLSHLLMGDRYTPASEYDGSLSVGDPGYRPYCSCPTMQRMVRDAAAWRCEQCGGTTRTVNGKDIFDACAPTQEATPRASHLAWCRERALAEIDGGNPMNAVASMASDLRKFEGPPLYDPQILQMLMADGMLSCRSQEGARRWVRGFA